MRYKSRRDPPALRRAGNGFAEADRDDPSLFAKRIAELVLGKIESPLPELPPDEAALTEDDPAAREAAFEEIGDVSYLFPDEAGMAAIRSVKPDYRPPTREERARNFLSDYLLCASLLESHEWTERVYARISADCPPRSDGQTFGNVKYWKSRCHAVSSLVASLMPSREKLLLTLRYLRGMPLERAAEQMSVSRRTAYRIHARALTLVGRVLERKRKG